MRQRDERRKEGERGGREVGGILRGVEREGGREGREVG